MSHGREIFECLLAMAMPPDDHAVFGSGPLLAHGIIDSVDDLDVICRGRAWERAVSIGEPVLLEDGITVISTHDGAITFGRSWRYGDFDIDELIDTAEMIAGVPCVRLGHVVAYKQAADRPKDRSHLAAVEAAGFDVPPHP
jgi:hypothetical protein